MGQNLNVGQDNSLVVYGNPESFKKLIKNHGQLCKIKQAILCPCVTANNGSADMYCTICKGTGFIYSYQRRFMVADEQSQVNCNVTEVNPYYVPVLEVSKVERVTSTVQGGIQTMPVQSFNETTIFVENNINAKYYDKMRVTYFFDGWTKVEGDILTVNEDHGLMFPTQTFFNAGYQSSNPLQAEADITQINRIYNIVTGAEITEYTRLGNAIKTKEPIVSGQMAADYYYADLTQIITADLKMKDDNEVWSYDMTSGNLRLALFPWWNVAKGDIVVIAADAQFKTELFVHRGDLDQLFQMEVVELNDVCIDSDGNTYYRDEDYILVGNRYVSWISDNKPKDEKTVSLRYGFKPAFICFEDQPERNNLENKKYPTIIYVKAWTKTSKDDITKLLTAVQ